MGLLLGPADSPATGGDAAILVGVAIALVAVNFAWIYPVLTDELVPYSSGWLECGCGPGSSAVRAAT